MAQLPVQLPLLQNWSCHSCSGCCRQHGIVITEEERQRIAGQNWTVADGIPADRPWYVREGGWGRRTWYRLAHQPDGSCVFLDPQGLCRIHGKFGESAKPLACRIYPYAFHPAGKTLRVSLRFSCPSVVMNLGQPVASQRGELRRLVELVVPDDALETPPPPVHGNVWHEWEDVLAITRALESTMTGTGTFLVRLLRSLHWLELIRQARLEKITGPRMEEFVTLLSQAAESELPETPDLPLPSKLSRIMFRILAGQYARQDAYGTMDSSWRGRWRLFRYAMRLTRGRGLLPPLRNELHALPFDQLEREYGGIDADTEELFTRYTLVKLQGFHFCGRAFYGFGLVEGWSALALVFPVTLWIARWLAASAGRDRLTREDVAQALSFADHHHGYSAAFGTWSHRRRISSLITLGDIPRLCVHYFR